ncbi:MAG: hypothetical protein ACJ8LL_00635 [Candidatus Udaeobacter sp.]
MKNAETEGVNRNIVLDATCIAVLIAYFLYFALPARRGGFRGDEMTNMVIYWQSGMLKSLWANVAFWTTFYRPGGALYYLPLYHFFGLNPEPYRIVQISVLAASIPIVYYLNRVLAPSRLVAFLATLVLCYHAALINLAFVGSYIYDVLCGFFYLAALSFYIHIRERGAGLRPLQMVGFLALYVCALDFKEMAVTLPVMVLIYELLKCHRWSDWKQFSRWACSSAAPALIAGLLTVPYIYSKTCGTGALTNAYLYQPHYSWSNFLKSNTHFLSELFYFGFHNYVISQKACLVLWALVFLYAFLRRDLTLKLMAFWTVIVPLPLAFIPLRGGACLYLLLFAWAMIFARVVWDLITLISKSGILVGQRVGAGTATGAITAGVVSGNVRGAAVGAAIGTMSAATFRVVAVLSVASALAIFTHWKIQSYGTVQRWLSVGQKVPHVIAALKSLHFQPAPRSTILLRIPENLLVNKAHAVFIAYLVWNDRSLHISLESANEPAPQQLPGVDCMVSLDEFQAKLIRSPLESH